MKQKRFLGFLPVFCLLACAQLVLAGQDTLKLGSATGEFGTNVNVPLTLTSGSDVQGLVAAFDWNGADGTGIDLVAEAAIGTADVVSRRVEADYMVLGVVVDADGTEPSAIPAGTDILIATAVIQCGPGPAETTTAVEFRDGAYAMVDGGPTLDNILVVGGLSIGLSDGIVLQNGQFRCIPTPDRLTVEDGSNPADGSDRCGSARVLMQNNAPVEGFVVAVCHGGGLTLTSISLGADAAAADFFETEIDGPNGGTAGVVMDLVDPTPAGVFVDPGANHVLTYNYCCAEQAEGAPATTHDLVLCDGQLGSPLKDNILVVGGLSIGVSDGLVLENGVFTCNAPVPPETNIVFKCSGRDGAELVASRSTPDVPSTLEVCFAICNPETNEVGHAQNDHIQGFSMAVKYCQDFLSCRENFDIRGTILEALGAEFVSIQCNDESGELIIGVLIDALPPFDGATITPDFRPIPVGYVTFDVSEDAPCSEDEPSCFIEFQDGLMGNGRVPIKNLVSTENHAFSPDKENCPVFFLREARFYRGDCNFSLEGMGMAVNIADAAAVVSGLFLPGSWQFDIQCPDACDCNDDGRVDLADSICILQYLFMPQARVVPPAPGPGWDPASLVATPVGTDPTPDKLDCPIGSACELRPH